MLARGAGPPIPFQVTPHTKATTAPILTGRADPAGLFQALPQAIGLHAKTMPFFAGWGL